VSQHQDQRANDRTFIRQIRTRLRAICPRTVLMWREAQYFKHHGEFELGFVEHLCRPTQDAIDVGANEGSYIHFMRRYARRAYAFEPVPWLAERLHDKFGDDVTVIPAALSDTAGRAQLRIPVIDGELITGLSSLDTPAGTATDMREVEVETVALDDAYSGDLGFIKIDVEGHEDAVLRGARRTVARCRPRVQIEIIEDLSPGGLCRADAFFGELGYRGYFVWRDALMPVAAFDAAAMQRAEVVEGYGPGIERRVFGRYVANFLFLPKEEPAATFENLQTVIDRARRQQPADLAAVDAAA
jgi:FkbM family methyltransferase